MKKAVITFAITLSLLLSSTSFAFIKTDKTSNFSGSWVKKSEQENFLKAIRLRHRKLLREKQETQSQEEIKNQHYKNLKDNYISTSIDSGISREGELKTYDNARTVNGYKTVSVNSKVTFKKRLFCYFFQREQANSECLSSGGVNGETHRVVPFSRSNDAKESLGETILATRDLVRNLGQEKMGIEKNATYRSGDYYRNFTSPFIKSEL